MMIGGAEATPMTTIDMVSNSNDDGFIMATGMLPLFFLKRNVIDIVLHTVEFLLSMYAFFTQQSDI